jgi:mannose-1-phosphate guanylyltransferase/phosphomannomutase
MKAVIMAGGFGTRLRPLTCNIPKPMVPMANRPMMHRIVDLLTQHGFDDIVSLLFYHPAAIRNYFGDGSAHGIRMQYMQAEADFGTAGSVRNAQEKLGDGRILIISGDVLTDFDLTAALRFHEEKGADATLVLTRMPDPLAFGVVITDDEGTVTRFLEKPSWGEVFSDTINTGIYIIEHRVLQMIPYKQDFDFSKNLFPLMMQERMKLCGYIAEGYWRDVGTLGEYQEANLDCLSGRVRVRFDGEPASYGFVGAGSETHPESFSGRCVVGSGCRIAPSARIINSVIGNGATIYSGAVLQNCVIWDAATIEENVQISDSTVGFESVLHPGTTVAENVFISDRCVIGPDASLLSNIKLWPDKVVHEGATLAKSLVWEDRWLRDLFTDARITGAANIDVNPEFGAKLGAALGAVVGMGRTVLSSRDPDNASRMIKRAITSGLMSAGVSVYDMQTTSIPMVRQELRNGRCAAGFHVRKSPFDKRSMDIIFFDGEGKDLGTGKTKSIERQFFSEDFPRADFAGVGRLSFPERSNEYYRHRFFSTLDTALIARGEFRVVIDYSFGIASTLFPNILGEIGTNVVSLNAYIDASRLARTGQEFQAACDHISTIVRSLSSDVGFLIDAGAEKLFISDENGAFIRDDRLLPVVTKLFLESRRRLGLAVERIGCPVSATAEMDLVAEEYGAAVLRTTSTHGGMMNAVFEHPDLAFVGGTKGGFIFPEFSFATDAMYSIAKILEMMAATGLKLGQIDASIERLHRRERDISCPWDAKGRIMRRIMRDSAEQERLLVDGICIRFDRRTSVLLSPSKEHELFHIRVEADSPERADTLACEYEQKVVHWRDNP